MKPLPALGLALTLAACANTSTGAASGAAVAPARASDENPFGYQAEYAKLKADCERRGGYLAPTNAAPTGRPATDYSCNIRGGTSDYFRR